MARIPDDEIARLKTDVSLLRLVEAQGIALTLHGKDRIGRCPFHDDKTPSLVITPETNLWHCLGACNTGGSVIDWVMKAEGVSFRHACELLREQPVLQNVLAGAVTKKSTVPKLSSPLAADSNDQQLLQRVVAYYHETLKQSPEALAYLAARGLNHPDVIATFQLGFSNRSLGYRLPQKNRVDGAQIRGRLQALGVYRDSGHEHLNGSLVVPLFDAHNQVVQLYGRKLLGNRLTAGTPIHLYLPGPQRGVFNLDVQGCTSVAGAGSAGATDAFKSSSEMIVCEALLDALTFWCAGYRNVTSAYGVNGFTDELFNAFKEHKIQRVLIAYDRDEAGDKAAAQLAEKLMAAGMECFRVLFPKGMDANEYALKVTPAQKSLGVVLRKAEWLGKGVAPALHIAPANDDRINIPTTCVQSSAVENNVMTETTKPVEEKTPIPSLAAVVPVVTLPASPLPEIKSPSIDAEVIDGDVHITFADRHYRVRGHANNSAPEQLKINLLVNTEKGMHIDTLDLYSAKARQVFIKQTSLELSTNEDLIKTDVGKVLLHLESLHDAKLKELTTPKESNPLQLNDTDQAAALALLQSPNLLQRILDDFALCGVVGEETNKLVGYLACVSRKLDKPLAVIIQSSSAAGKSSLMDAVLQMIPREERVQYSAMTGQSLFYMGETNLKHKILAIAEEEGAARASYALKLLQSDGSLTMASTGKDPVTGNLITQEYHVEGPVMIFLTTTAIDIDEELLNRCVVLTVNESREQTRAIHAQQRARRTLAGLQAKVERERIINTHANAQRLLRSLVVINPYADQLTFLDSKTRTRRDHEKYLSLIDSIALLHQHQRPIKKLLHDVQGWTSAASAGSAGAATEQAMEYVEVTLDDIAMANTLAHDVLGRSLDELPPQTRKLLQLINAMVNERCTQQATKVADYRFSRKAVRDVTGWGDTQLRVHLDRLTQMEYLITHRGTRGQSFVYELLWDAKTDNASAHLPGLLDVESLKSMTTTQSSRGEAGEFAGSTRPQNGGLAGGSRPAKNTKTIEKKHVENVLPDELIENARPVQKINNESYTQVSSLAAASSSS